ncbi:putative membrane protein YfcA [Nakamurella sp. UYEF19]|uniref:sulfite exporter TauE/SafE family protein n=1 Tax=Nakamurella sp. UYEF19 TaxID=1756392 RepID=UPI0033997ABD
MNVGTGVLLGAAGVVAGSFNAVAGGGSLISFPALLAAGYGGVTANVTNTVALWPGYLGGAIGYRSELARDAPRAVKLAAVAVVGSAIGSIVLLTTPATAFTALVPWLILAATAVFAMQPLLAARISRTRGAAQTTGKVAGRDREPAAERDGETAAERDGETAAERDGETAAERDGEPTPGRESRQAARRDAGSGQVLLYAGVLVSSAYGGYFGAGLGILLLGVLGALLPFGLQRINGLKNALSLAINTLAMVAFVLFGPVAWLPVLIMAVASLFGGYVGARVARRLPVVALRIAVITFGSIVGLKLLFWP